MGNSIRTKCRLFVSRNSLQDRKNIWTTHQTWHSRSVSQLGRLPQRFNSWNPASSVKTQWIVIIHFTWRCLATVYRPCIRIIRTYTTELARPIELDPDFRWEISLFELSCPAALADEGSASGDFIGLIYCALILPQPIWSTLARCLPSFNCFWPALYLSLTILITCLWRELLLSKTYALKYWHWPANECPLNQARHRHGWSSILDVIVCGNGYK
jgi:hypothetical protein